MQQDHQSAGASRRTVLTGAASVALLAASPAARATMAEMDEAIRAFTGGAPTPPRASPWVARSLPPMALITSASSIPSRSRR